MKKLILALSIAALSFTVSATPYDQPVKSERKEQAQAAASLVKAYGYRCDSISSFLPHNFSRGFTLRCNNFSYKYLIEDKGGRWTVTLD